MSKCQNMADQHVPFFNWDWYESDNIYGNIVYLAKLPKVNVHMKKLL